MNELSLNPRLSCASCKFYLTAAPGSDYAASPCSSCEMKQDYHAQKKQIIPTGRDPEMLIDFLERLRSIVGNEKRRRILFVILRNPGIHDSTVAERLEIPRRTVSHHIRIIRLMLPEVMQGKPYAV